MKTTGGTQLASIAFALVFSLLGSLASAAIVSVDVDGVQSWDGLGDGDNTVLTVDLAAALGGSASVVVDGIGWDVGIDSIGDSWLSEATVSFQDSSGSASVNLAPGIDDPFAGSGLYDSGDITDLVPLGLDFTLVDGILRLEFFESYDDIDGSIDAMWSGTLEIRASLVPVPPAIALMIFGLSALGFGFGRRRNP